MKLIVEAISRPIFSVAGMTMLVCSVIVTSDIASAQTRTIDVTPQGVLDRAVGYCNDEGRTERDDFSVEFCPDPRAQYAQPSSVKEAINQLTMTLSASTRLRLKAYCEESQIEEFSEQEVGNSALFLMAWMRVAWDLDNVHSNLGSYFSSLGLNNGRSISGVLLDTYCAESHPGSIAPSEVLDALTLSVHRESVPEN